MKTLKQLLIPIIVMGMFSGKLSAQTIPNPDFEQTDTVNTYPFFTNWTSDGTGAAISNLSHNGNYSLSVWNWYWYGKAYANNGADDGFGFGSAHKSGTPYTQKATKMNGFYRYDTTGTYSTNDSGLVAVLLKKYNTITQQVDTIGYGKVNLPSYSPTDNSFAPFEIIIDDIQPGIQPDSIVVYVQSSLDGFCATAGVGICLYLNVDFLSLETPLGITDVKGKILQPEIFPNPTEGNFSIQFPSTEMETVRVFNLTGELINQLELNHSNKIDLSLRDFDSGLYLVEIKDIEGNIYTQRLIKN